MLGYLIAAAASGLFVGLGLSYAYHRAAFADLANKLNSETLYAKDCVEDRNRLHLETVRQDTLIGSLQSKLFAIADVTRNGKSGTARMVYKMTGRCHD